MLSSSFFPLFILASAGLASPQPGSPTFNDDVAPILFEHCASCHRSGGWAPFSVHSYPTVRDHAESILQAVRSGAMPPWLPDSDAVRFASERRLSGEDIRTLKEWVDAGAVEGDPQNTPRIPPLAVGWQNGEPDLIVRVSRAFTLPADGEDVYRNFVIPIPVAASRWVRAVELRPDPRHVVHHARMLVDTTGSARKLDGKDPEPGYDGMLLDDAEFPDGHFLGWAPGKVASPGSPELAWRLESGTDLILQLHMLPTGRAERVGASVGFFFSDRPPARSLAILQLGSKTIDIAAGVIDHVVEDDYVLPADVELVSVYPHAHYLARQMESEAILPDGTRRWLLKIPRWDFFWQDHYRYFEPIALPRGTRITMRYVYDNNVAEPPRAVRFGARSSDEMGDLLFQVMPRREHDLAMLRSHFLRNEIRQDIAGYEKTLADTPADSDTRHLLALSFLETGRTQEAITELERLIATNPELMQAHYNLANALASGGRRIEAIAHLTRAIELSPTNAEAHNNLAILLQQQGELDEAISHYQRALAARPDYAYAHHNLASALLAHGQLERALSHLRIALRIRPDYAEAHYTLARALGAQGKLDEEILHYREAVRSRPDYAEARNNLANALLSRGHRAEAIEQLRAAIVSRPGYMLAHINLAEALDQANQRDEARVWLDRALKLAEQSGDVSAAEDIRRRRRAMRPD